MHRTVKAVYRQGTFLVREPCDLPDGAEVSLIIQGPLVVPPAITDLHQRARILRTVTKRMQQNPLPAEAPRFTREELHERR